ncbi:single-stranded DNA-binding protein [Spirochaeta cellobiosiphila]|uniref:single-stranded DNA-binding protein n=1 Tax=Spirochaeta cellobiosiphila TaxID=504483 RepID=UPI000427D5C3|nr:single-stranded DNA-binding protein [Spirochaeta cellobiosiphila]
MADINQVVIVGRLTRDAELRYTNTGTAVGRMSIAVNRRRRSDSGSNEETSFFDVVLWGKTAESLNQYLQKGKQIAIQGELRQNRWEQDGQSRSRIEIHAMNVQLLGGGGRGDATGNSRPAENRSTYQPSYQNSSNNGPEPFEDDIPF